MSNFARIINNVAVDVSTNPQEQFHPDIAAEFEPVPDDVQAGWARNEAGEWVAPAPTPEPTPAPTESPKVSPVEFKLLFTAQERVAIKAERGNDLMIDDFFEIVEDPRLTHVNLGLKSTQDALGYLETKGLITDARRVQILAGKIQ
jgi:hypothetical protein